MGVNNSYLWKPNNRKKAQICLLTKKTIQLKLDLDFENLGWHIKILIFFLFRFRLHRNWPRTHFILNLAFADLLMCGIGFPFQIFVYFHRSWEWGIRSCQIIANVLHIIYYSEWFSVAMVAATCCITITKPRGLYSFFMKRSNRIIVILSIWSLGFTLLLPTNLQVTKYSLNKNISFTYLV